MTISGQQPVRVIVVDDSLTARELLVAVFEQSGQIQVVGVGETGEDALRLVRRMRPDVLAMDIIMPKMDGLEATRRIMQETPTPIVLLTSTVMTSDVNLTFDAMRLGALAVVNKPGLNDAEAWNTVIQTIRLMAKVPVIHRWGEGRKPAAAAVSPPVDTPAQTMQIIGIGASTGGPAALAAVLEPLPADYPIPILIVQHITKGFGLGLTNWLSTQTALEVVLAGHGDMPKRGRVMVAPDDYHTRINSRGVIELSKEPPYKGLRPSINMMFDALAQVYGARAVGVQLTGMGDDGVEGLSALHTRGGWVIAQDAKSCVVASMPSEAVAAKAVDEVLTPAQIAQRLLELGRAREQEVS